MKKLLCFIATFSLLINTLLAPMSVLAQSVDESPTPTLEPTSTPETTVEPSVAPTETPAAEPTIAPTEIATPTPTPEPIESLDTTSTDQPVETQAPESNPTTTSPPTSTKSTPTPIVTPIASTETGHISATILENTKIDESEIADFDLTYQEDGSATISTDKLDYAPTDTAVVTGSGFIANKTYTINIISSDEPTVDYSAPITANEEGEILHSYTLDGTYRPNYQVKIKDLEKVIAETTFTDSPVFNFTGNVEGWVGASGLSVTGNTTGDFNTNITGILTEYSNPTQRVSFAGTISGDITGTMIGSVNYNGYDTLFAEITGSVASGHVYLIGSFSGPTGHFTGKFVNQTDPISLITSITISGNNSVQLGNTSQMIATTTNGTSEIA